MICAKKTILIVDDHEAIVDALETLLEEDFDVVTATSIPEARKALGKKQPDLILLDCILPGISGLVFLREIRKMKIPTKVVAITGSSWEWVRDEIDELGIDGFLPKPFDVSAIIGFAEAV